MSDYNTYQTKTFNQWSNVEADLAITDPPFGIDFGNEKENYNRDSDNVVGGYVEWEEEEYRKKISDLISVLIDNISQNGQILMFSGMDNAHIIHQEFLSSEINFQGKLYWNYNFAPYCSRRPAHNVYEVFWGTKDDEEWYYQNDCSFDHCEKGESNLSSIFVKRTYKKNVEKYPTRLPFKIIKILLEHFSTEEDIIFDPLAGSGNLGIVCEQKNRKYILGDINSEAKNIFKRNKESVLINTDDSLMDY